MTVYTHALKRILKNKIQLLLLLIMPLLSMSIPLLGGLDHPIRVGLVDHDGTAFTTTLTEDLKTKSVVKSLTEADLSQQLIDQRIDYALVLDKGFTDRLIRGEDAKVKAYSIQQTNVSLPIKTYLDSYLAAASRISDAAKHDPQAFAKGMELFRDSSLGMKFELSGEGDRMKSYTVLGIFVLFMMYSSAFSSLMILTDKQGRTLHRSLTAPIRMRSYMLQNVMAFVSVSFLQVGVILLALIYGFDLYLGKSPWAIFLLLLVFSFVSVSLGVLLASLAKSMTQAILVGISIIIPCAMLGGAYWPIDLYPKFVQKIGWFDPVTWVMTGIDELLYDGNLASILGEIGTLVLFAAAFFLLGTLRKVDISK